MKVRANAIVLAILVVLVVFGLLLEMLPSSSSGPWGSVLDDSTHGRSVAFALLRELGFETKPWSDSPGELPDGGGLLVLERPPGRPPGYAVPGDEDGVDAEEPRPTEPIHGPGARRLRDPLHYVRFVEQGGVLLLGSDGRTLDLLADVFALSAAQELTRLSTESAPGDTVRFAGGEELVTAWRPDHHFAAPARDSGFAVVLEDAFENALAVRHELGRGSILLLADGLDFLDNRQVDEQGNALFLVRLIEAFAHPGDTIWFDEYVLGGWTPDTALELAFAPGNFVFTTHLLALLALLVWSSAWAREFPRDPPAIGTLSAIVRARGFAGMLTRARRWDLLARMLRAGVLRRLSVRAGRRLEHETPEEGWDPGGVLEPATVHSVLAPLLSSLDEEERARREALFTGAGPGGGIATRADLERLAHQLARLEEEAGVRPQERREDHDRGVEPQ